MQRRSRIVVFAATALLFAAIFAAPPEVLAAPGSAPAPGDASWAEQWSMGPESGGGIDLLAAWAYSRGRGVVVAVVDSGYIDHPEFAGRILQGFDFISSPTRAGDGDGRDADAHDPGDRVTNAEIESGEFGSQCGVEPSVWHGTHVAGIILAGAEPPGAKHAQNDRGVAGVAPEALLLPVRAIGRCGGSEADLRDAIRWAAGLPVDGVPANEHPAAVINLSLSSQGACSPEMQATVDAAIAAGAMLVTSVGNDAADASDYSPANCIGTLTVGALEHGGQRATYSNYGPYVDLSAPGGTPEEGVLSAVDAGIDAPIGASYATYAGTSMAAPHVAGILALARAIDPDLPATDLYSMLLNSLAPFASSSRRFGCNIPDMCGIGAASASRLMTAMAAREPAPSVVVSAPARLPWDGATTVSASAADQTPLSLQSITPRTCAVSGDVVTALAAGSCTLRFHAPGSVARQPIEVRARIAIIGVQPTLRATLPATLRIGSAVTARIVTSKGLSPVAKSLTPRTCSANRNGTLRALRSGTCQVRISVGPNGKFRARSIVVTVRINR